MTPMLRDAYYALREARTWLSCACGSLIMARDIARQLGYEGWMDIEEVLNAVEVALDDQTEFAFNIARDNRTNPNTCLTAEIGVMNKHLKSLPFDMPRDVAPPNQGVVEQARHD